MKTVAVSIPLAATGSRLFAGQKSTRQPNIVYVFADQMRKHVLGCYGNQIVPTPNFDAMGAAGTVFDNAISTWPVCSPYRAMLLTGRQPMSNGTVSNDTGLRDNLPTIAKVAKAQGYATGYVGKWHLEWNRTPFVPAERRQGFDYWAVNNCSHRYMNHFYCTDTPKQIRFKGYEPLIQTDLAIDYIRQKRDRPFCLFLSWGTPHDPYNLVPDEYKRRIPLDKIELRENVTERAVVDHLLARDKPSKQLQARRKQRRANIDDNERLRRQCLQGYYAHTAALDDCIGKIRSTLTQTGLADDTILVFSSDHGDMLGSHGLSYKQHAYDESILVPLLIRCPRGSGAGGRDEAAIVSVPDLMPTLLAMVGAVIPKTVHGRDLSRVLRGDCPAPEDDGALLTCYRPFHQIRYDNVFGDYRGLRTRRYTYVRDHDGPTMLFDNEADPYQMQNLSADPAVRPTVEALEMRLQAELAATGDEFLTGDQLAARYGIVLNGDGDVMHFPDDPAGWTSVPPRAVGCHCLWPPAFRCERRGR